MSDTKEVATIKKYQSENAMVLVHEEDLHTQRLFKPVLTKLEVTKNDFHDYPIQGKMMPKSHHVDRIGEAAGVEFIAGDVRKEGDSTWVGWAQGRRRMPDGSYRTSSVQQYEFDVDVRSEEDFLNDKKGRYTSDIEKRKHVLELKKVARQRAATGARLRVIRELVGIPIAFSKDDFMRALVVSRIQVNTDEMLADPGMRQAAIGHAVGAAESMYGSPERDVTPSAAALPQARDAEGGMEDFEDDIADPGPIVGERKAELWRALEDFEAGYELPENAQRNVDAFRADLPGADESRMERLVAFLNQWAPNNEGARR